jgi:hypothetical protein
MGLASRIYDATWGRGFTALYDRGLKATEEAGLREMRRELLAEASGRTIDIGAGTGVNIELFPPPVTELVLAEPDPHMVAKLRPKLHASRVEAEVVEAPAERLPFEASSFDTAVLRPWRFAADGCHCNRDTVELIESSSFELQRVERGSLPKAPPIVRPLARGSATLGA